MIPKSRIREPPESRRQSPIFLKKWAPFYVPSSCRVFLGKSLFERRDYFEEAKSRLDYGRGGWLFRLLDYRVSNGGSNSEILDGMH